MSVSSGEAGPSRTRRRFIAAGLTAIVIVGIVAIYVFKIAERMPDYDVYRRAAERALVAAPLYRPDDGHFQFKYLPAFAVVMLPLALVPEAVARACWFAASILILVVLLRKTVSVLPDRHHSRAWLIGITFVLLAKFYAHELELGQVNIAMTAFVVLALAQMRAGRELGAGLLIAAAIVLKPYAVLLLPWLVARRRMASLAGAALGIAAALLLPVAVYGFEGNLHLLGEWWRTVTETTAPNLADFNNVSAASVFARRLGPGPVAQALAVALVCALLAVAAAVFFKRSPIPAPEPLEAGLLLTLMPIISPQGWDYVFLLSTLATMLLVNYRAQLPTVIKSVVTGALIVIAFSIYDLVGRAVYQQFMRMSIITICYLAVIGGLAALRWRKVA
ncbi:MAG: glycosyltransferase family 87 protein [Vicinamibacterales bacterium]